jgi:hypothetical protein
MIAGSSGQIDPQTARDHETGALGGGRIEGMEGMEVVVAAQERTGR